MGQSINLIPQIEQQEQQKTRLVKFSTIFALIMLLLVGGFSLYLFFVSMDMDNKLVIEEQNAKSLRAEITSKSDIEVTARNLDKKASTVSQIISGTETFSLLLKDLLLRTPDSINFTDLTLNPDSTLSLSGTADNYLSVSDFTKALVDTNVLQTTMAADYPELNNKKIFQSVTLNSVSLETQQNNVKFFLVLSYLKEALVK